MCACLMKQIHLLTTSTTIESTSSKHVSKHIARKMIDFGENSKKRRTFFLRILKHFAVSIYFANCLDLFDAKIFNKIKIGCKY